MNRTSGLNQKALRRILGYAERAFQKCSRREKDYTLIVEWLDRRFHFIPGNPFGYRLWIKEAITQVCTVN